MQRCKNDMVLIQLVIFILLFIIYINDLVEHVNNGSDLYLYADDAKLFSFIKTMEDSATLQKYLNSLTQWMETWLRRRADLWRYVAVELLFICAERIHRPRGVSF